MAKGTKDKKRTLIFPAILFIMAFGILTVSAVVNQKLVKSVENNFRPAEISTAVLENEELALEEYEEENENPVKAEELEWKIDEENYRAEKKAAILNVDEEGVNNARAWIRVCLVPRWTEAVAYAQEDSEQKATDWSFDDAVMDTGALEAAGIIDDKYTLGDVTLYLDQDWEKNGWFFNPADGYFYYAFPVDPGERTEALLDHVSVEKNKLETAYAGRTLQVDILADAIQTEGRALEQRWEQAGIRVAQDGRLTVQQQEGAGD